MFCGKCGTNVPDGQAFCPSCGNVVSAGNQQPPAQPGYAPQPNYQQPPVQPGYYQAPVNALGMKWYKFLIYFALFAGAVMNVIGAIMTMTGVQYEGYAELVYAFIDGLQALDIFYGLACIAQAAFMVYIRFRLSGYYANGPKLVLINYAVGIVLIAIYNFIGMAILSDASYGMVDTSQMLVSVIFSAISYGVAIILNNIYFKKRAHLFVK